MEKVPPKLGYASPKPASTVSMAIVFGVFGLVIGAFGCLMILFGGIGLYHAHHHPNYVTHQGDIFNAIVYLFLGTFCGWACYRQTRHTFRVLIAR